MADTLESLEIEVKHSASGAAGEISGVANALHDLSSQIAKVLPNLKELAATLSKVKGNVNININSNGSAGAADPQHSSSGNPSQWAREMTAVIESEDKGVFENLGDVLDTSGIHEAQESAQTAATQIRSVFSVAADKMKGDLEKVANVAQKVLHPVTSALSGLGKAFSKVGGIAKSGLGKMEKAFEGLKNTVKGAGKPVLKLLSSLGRVAFYRLIRGMLKAVSEAFKEGLEHAYAFSAGMTNESHRFAEALDSMKSKSGEMKGQLGAAFAALLAAIQPIIETLINLVIRAANAITQFLSAFTGGRYLKATAVSEQFADNMKKGAGSAKEWKNQLLGFDEINRLNEPSGGGGGGGAEIDPMSRFTDEEIDSRIKKFVDDLKKSIKNGDWSGAGKLIGEAINSIFPKESKWQAWGSKLGYGLNGAIGVLYNTLETIDFNSIGSKVASFLNASLEQIDFTVWGRLFIRKITLAIDFFLGFLGTIDWGLVGKSIGDFLYGAINEASEWIQSQDWGNLGATLVQKIKDVIDNIDIGEVTGSLSDLVSNAINGLADFINGATSGDLISSITDFFTRAIDGVKIGKILSALTNLLTTVVLNIPVILLQLVSGISDTIGDIFELLGLDSVAGFFHGISEKISGAATWLKENFVDPIVNGVKDLLGIHSPSTVFADIGGNIVEGLQSGMTDMWSGIELWISEHFGWLISWCQSACNWLNSVLVGVGLVNGATIGSTWQNGGGFSGSSGKFADGGFPSEGQLFMAREAGPELVGTMGGRTAVANNDQIVEGIRQGVYDAVLAANANNGGGGEFRLYLDSKQIKYGLERVDRAWGV